MTKKDQRHILNLAAQMYGALPTMLPNTPSSID
nr:MAG TPA: hypothetical protein [Caudoviricetes sp.]